jgi:probable HAF family extracellular repeat protein
LASGNYHAFLDDGKGMTDLGTLGGNYSEANRINDSGAVTGFSYLAGDAFAHAFVFENGVMTDLDTLGGANSYSYGINNAGQAVGSSDIAGGKASHAFLYADGEMLDLNSLVGPGFGWTLNYAADINDLGQITAHGCNSLGLCRGFLLTLDDGSVAVPEPGTPAIMLLGAGLMLLGARRGRRGRAFR